MEKQIMQTLEFQKGVLAPLPQVPTLLPKARAKLRQNLLQEEVTEISTAVEDWYHPVPNFSDGDSEQPTEEETLTEILDGIIDSIYILLGTAHEYGLADRLIMAFDEVHNSNMSKFDENGKAIFREDGKVIKGERYRAPNLTQIIKKDLTVFKSEEVQALNEVIQNEQKEFIKKVDNKILELLPKDKKLSWASFVSLSEEFSEIIEVSYDFSDLLNGRKATVTINGETNVIKENNNLVD
jgi:predicted HAD superfamily Cof-like phosphohydrolase